MKTASSTLFQLLREESSVSEDSVFGIHLFANWYKYTCNVFMRTKIHVTFSWDYLWLAEWGNAVKNHHFTPKCSSDVSLQITPNRNCTFSWTSDSITWSPPRKLDLLMENLDSFFDFRYDHLKSPSTLSLQNGTVHGEFQHCRDFNV